jgi:hypothetical protein
VLGSHQRDGQEKSGASQPDGHGGAFEDDRLHIEYKFRLTAIAAVSGPKL